MHITGTQSKLFIHALVWFQQLSPNTAYVECQYHLVLVVVAMSVQYLL
jgi:hypothetical protein